jgi:pantoate--beta-alanine ligase
MLTIASPDEMRAWARERAADGRTVGLVPTMGALHNGHLALIADAARRCDEVVVSIFVNPLQFNEAADFDGYPRPIDHDVAACEAAGVSVVYAPSRTAMYPEHFQTRVVPGALAELMEGPMRPGHLEGVVTVVAKLFGAVRPDVSIFGQKDFQQLAIVTQMAADLDMGIEVIGHPIMRDSDGVAQSSRNRLLTPAQRDAAICVPRSLAAARAAAATGAAPDDVVAAAAAIIDGERSAKREYTTVFDVRTLTELDRFDASDRLPGAVRIATAIWFGDVRLIDNCDLFGD